MATSTPRQTREQAARVAARIERVLDAAEELKGGYEDLVGADRANADNWRLKSAQTDPHINFLRATLDLARKAAAGDTAQ